ncbi:hypothetical protein [Burkholderia savannae]|uniref:hypothetical protein n=1 Tax=Burkholderia savannae TaxID=1637837 RepID=UPI0012F490AE|nr:hypothetical protein [Burkholderia savannae]
MIAASQKRLTIADHAPVPLRKSNEANAACKPYPRFDEHCSRGADVDCRATRMIILDIQSALHRFGRCRRHRIADASTTSAAYPIAKIGMRSLTISLLRRLGSKRHKQRFSVTPISGAQLRAQSAHFDMCDIRLSLLGRRVLRVDAIRSRPQSIASTNGVMDTGLRRTMHTSSVLLFAGIDCRIAGTRQRIPIVRNGYTFRCSLLGKSMLMSCVSCV